MLTLSRLNRLVRRAPAAGLRPALDLNFLAGVVDPRISLSRPSAATRFNAAGQLETVAAGVPRIDYDPATLACKGLLVEEQRTNLLPFITPGAPWVTNPAATAGAGVAPDGSMSAARLDAVAASNGYAYTEASVTPGTTYTFSVFVKLGTLPASDFKLAFFDVTSSAFIAADVVPSLAPVAGAWRRITYTVTTPVGCSLLRPYAYRNMTPVTGGSVYLWGAQLEAGAFTTSYIPTAAAQATRAADTATMALGGWFNESEGALAVDYMLGAVGASYSRCAAIIGKAGVGSVGIAAIFNDQSGDQAGFNVYNDAAAYQGVASPAPVVAVDSIIRTAGAYRADDSAASTNGLPAVTDTTAVLATGLDVLRLGANASSANVLSGHLRRLRYYRTRLSNAQLQGLTA